MIRVYEGTTRLQKIGICEGIKAKNLKVGDVLVWNFGGTSIVKEITFSKTGKTLTIIEECNGKDYTRRLGAERIVVVKELNPAEAVEEVEVDAVEEMIAEAKAVVEGLKDMTPAEAVKVVDETLDKIDSIINTIEEDEKRWELRDIENHLKWVFGALEEMAEVEAREEAEAVVEPAPAQPKKNKSAFGKWLEVFVEEKGLDLNSEFTVEHREELHFVSLGFLLEVIEQASKEEQAKIKNILVQIDFRNGDVMHFFNHLSHGYIKSNY